MHNNTVNTNQFKYLMEAQRPVCVFFYNGFEPSPSPKKLRAHVIEPEHEDREKMRDMCIRESLDYLHNCPGKYTAVMHPHSKSGRARRFTCYIDTEMEITHEIIQRGQEAENDMMYSGQMSQESIEAIVEARLTKIIEEKEKADHVKKLQEQIETLSSKEHKFERIIDVIWEKVEPLLIPGMDSTVEVPMQGPEQPNGLNDLEAATVNFINQFGEEDFIRISNKLNTNPAMKNLVLKWLNT